MAGAIDLYVNANMSAEADNKFAKDVNRFYFKAGESFFKDLSMREFLIEMENAHVDHAVLSLDVEKPKDWILEFSRKRPDKFSLCPNINIDHGLDAVWALRDLAKTEKVVMARVFPGMFEKPPTHPYYYPLYAKCVEINLPLSIFTGIPGPRFDAASQDPIHLDRVCRDFPTLTLIMNHGADPWWDTAIRLMIKYDHLYMMTSAWLPKYLPKVLVHYMNTRGQHKVMWASDHPVLDMTRCLNGVGDLDLRPGVRDKYLRDNAKSVLKL